MTKQTTAAPTATPVYAFEEETEQAIVLAVCSEPRFYVAIGGALDSESMRNPCAKLLVSAAHAVHAKTGGGPSRPMFVVQHLATLMAGGKVTNAQLNKCKDYLIDAEMIGIADIDQLISATVPVVRRVKHKEAIVTALDDYKNDKDAEATEEAFSKLGKLGKTVNRWGSSLQQLMARPGFFGSSNDTKLPTGIDELDQAIGGGLEKSALGMFVGASGGGKSMALAHIGVTALLHGLDTVYVTLELSEASTGRRMLRNIVDMTQREIDLDPALAQTRLSQLTMGHLMLGYAEPIATSPKDIRARVREYQREHPSFNPRVFIIDFMDKLRVNTRVSLYEDMLMVAEGIRSMACEVDGWAWTASQADRKSTGKPWLDLDAAADSMNKVRTADLVIGIGRTEEDQAAGQVRISVPKRREGEGAHTHIGPVDWDPEHGRITMSTRKYPW